MLTRWYWQHFNHLINSIKIKCGRASTRTEQQFRQLSWDRGLSCNWSSRSPSWGWSKVALCTHSLNQAVTQSVSPSVSQSSVWQKPKLTMSKATSQKKKGSIVEFDFRLLLLLLLFLLSPYFCSPFCYFCCVSILKAWNHSGGEYAECVIKLAALQLTQLISRRRKKDCMRIIKILH